MSDSMKDLLRDRDELERAQIQAQLVQWTRTSAYGKTMGQLVAEELVKIKAARIEKDAAAGAAAAYAAAWQRGILSATTPATVLPQYAAPETIKTASQRRAERYQHCLDMGLVLPESEFGRMPNGIGEVAKALGITRQSLTDDLKKHIGELSEKRS